MLAIKIDQPDNYAGNDQDMRSVVVVERVLDEGIKRFPENERAYENPSGKDEPGA